MPVVKSVQQHRDISADFSFNGEEWHIRFRPYTLAQAQGAETGKLEGMIPLLLNITWWDLTYEDGTAFDVGEETLRSLDFDFIGAMAMALINAMNVPKANATR